MVERCGVEVVRVQIELEAFAVWCGGAGLEADAAVRIRNATESFATAD